MIPYDQRLREERKHRVNKVHLAINDLADLIDADPAALKDLDSVKDYLQRTFDEALYSLRNGDPETYSYARLADLLGVSPQAVHYRFKRLYRIRQQHGTQP
jgi:hypothetical protein